MNYTQEKDQVKYGVVKCMLDHHPRYFLSQGKTRFLDFRNYFLDFMHSEPNILIT